MAGPLQAATLANRRILSATIVLLGSFLTLPASAATPHHILCSEADGPTLEVAVESLTATNVNHEIPATTLPLTEHNAGEESGNIDAIVDEVELLAPRAKAVIRDAFNDRLVETSTDESEADEDESEAVAPRVMHTRLPGVSDEKLSQYKRQMFRRDI